MSDDQNKTQDSLASLRKSVQAMEHLVENHDVVRKLEQRTNIAYGTLLQFNKNELQSYFNKSANPTVANAFDLMSEMLLMASAVSLFRGGGGGGFVLGFLASVAIGTIGSVLNKKNKDLTKEITAELVRKPAP